MQIYLQFLLPEVLNRVYNRNNIGGMMNAIISCQYSVVSIQKLQITNNK